MRKIRLSDTDFELFDIEISPADFTFYTKHKDAFKTMWREQGKPFWTRFVITFRSLTVKHGVIKQMNIDTPKFQNLIDQAFIFIHEQFVDGKENMAKSFIEDIARLAQNQDKFPALDSKSFSKDPFYARDTRELFRTFFGSPDQKASYLKVYILSPVFLRFGGAVCRCLVRWVDADPMDKNDESYWTPPTSHVPENSSCVYDTTENAMCSNCIDECGTKFFQEKICGSPIEPRFLNYWRLGDPRFSDPDNPLFAPHSDPKVDWRDGLSVETFRTFMQFARSNYGSEKDKCAECAELKKNRDKIVSACRKKKRKKNKDKDGLKEAEPGLDSPEKDIHVKVEKKTTNEVKTENSPAGGGDNKSKKKKKGRGKKEKEEDEKTDEPKCTPEVHYSIMDGFKVYRSRTGNGVLEITITSQTSRTEKEEARHITALKSEFFKERKNSYLMHTKLVKEKIDNLPMRFEWWEGRGFCIAVLNYEKDERSHVNNNWTNFSLKVSGYNELAIKRTMLKLLLYVAKRKKRTPSNYWMMDMDDVLACILPEDAASVRDQTIKILRGRRFDDCLTQEETETLLLHQPYLNLKLVFMGLQDKEASNMLVEKGGKEKLKKIFKHIANKPIYGNNHQCHQANKIRSEQPNRNASQVIWDQMVEDPDAFEFTVLIDKKHEEEMKNLGLKVIDIRHHTSNVNPFLALCPNCKIASKMCNCRPPKKTPKKVIDFIDQTCFPIDSDDKEKAGGDNDIDNKSLILKKDETMSKEKPEVANGEKVETSAKKNDNDAAGLKDSDVSSVDADSSKEESEQEEKEGDSGESAVSQAPESKHANSIDGDIEMKEAANIDKADNRIASTIGKTVPIENGLEDSAEEKKDAIDDHTSDEELSDHMSAANINTEDGHKEDDMTENNMTKEKMDDQEDLIKQKLNQAYADKSEIQGLLKDNNTENNMRKEEAKDETAAKAKTPKKKIDPSEEMMKEIRGIRFDCRPDCRQKRKKDLKQKKKGKKGEHPEVMCNCRAKDARAAAAMRQGEDPDSKLNVTFDQAYAYIHGKVSHTDEMKDKMEGMDPKVQRQFHDQLLKRLREAKIEDIQDDLKEIGAYYTREQVVEMKKEMEQNFMAPGYDNNCLVKPGNKQVVVKQKVFTMSMTITATDKKTKKVIVSETRPIMETIVPETPCPTVGRIVDITDQVEEMPRPSVGRIIDITDQVKEMSCPTVEKIVDMTGQVKEMSRPTVEKIVDITDQLEEAEGGTNDLRICSTCGKKEPTRRAFKKCQKCRDESVSRVRYYCGRDCQVEDWIKRHKQEHIDNRL